LVIETKKISADGAVRANLKADMPIALVAIDQVYQAYRLADDQRLGEATTKQPGELMSVVRASIVMGRSGSVHRIATGTDVLAGFLSGSRESSCKGGFVLGEG
jgi:hypothetical protein